MTLLTITNYVEEFDTGLILIFLIPIVLTIVLIAAILKIFSINNKMDEILRNQNDIENLQLNTQNEIIDILKKIEMNTRQRN
jgi:uncharacterized membrane protein